MDTIRIKIKPAVAALDRPAVAEVYFGNRKVAEVVGTTEGQVGADGGWYPIAALGVTLIESE